jgi:hypothetical protein
VFYLTLSGVKNVGTSDPPLKVSRPSGYRSANDVTTGSGRQRLRWVLLSFVPSSLLLGFTAHITTDIASAPLFWVVPLALYLLTFAITFARRPLLPHPIMVRLFPIFLILLVLVGSWLPLPVVLLLPLNLCCFFAVAMVCHGELARQRPEADRLTEFYFYLSLGGVLGGLFNAILAPMLFPGVWEFPLVLVLACLVTPRSKTGGRLALLYDVLLPLTLFAFPFAIRLVPKAVGLPISADPLFVVIAAVLLLSFCERPLRLARAIAEFW